MDLDSTDFGADTKKLAGIDVTASVPLKTRSPVALTKEMWCPQMFDTDVRPSGPGSFK